MVVQSLRDVLDYRLKALFIGYNPSLRSAEVGHHYAGRSNRFWEILFQAGLTPHKFSPLEDEVLLTLGFGLTNIVHRPTKQAAEITAEEYRQGGQQLTEVLEKFRPQIACYVGMGVYRALTGKRKIPWGMQVEGVVSGVQDFVAPSSSGLNRMKMADQIVIFKELNELLHKK